MAQTVVIPRKLLQEGVRICTDGECFGVVLYSASGAVVGRYAGTDVATVAEGLRPSGVPHEVCTADIIQITR